MTNTTFKFYSDAGHGWIAVKYSFLQELGISKDISSYSYTKGSTVYLEEDSDAGKFFNAYESKYGIKPIYVEVVDRQGRTPNRSPIRSYRHYFAMKDGV